MRRIFWPFGNRSRPRGPFPGAVSGRVLRRPTLEWLENRILFHGDTLATAAPLSFSVLHTAQAAGFLAQPQQVDLYRVQLDRGDRLSAAVRAQTAGSGLAALLRVFDGAGRALARDDQEGGDPSLTFQAARAGDYYVGVSGAPNDAYDPATADSGNAGNTTGLYTLSLRDAAGASLQADLAGSSFRLGADTAAYGDTVPFAFTVEDRGGADAAAFQVQLLLSASNTFATAGSLLLQTYSVAGLGAGAAYSSGSLTVTLPDAAEAQAAGLPTSGPMYVGLRLVPADPTQDAGTIDKSGVHRGVDWERLTVLARVPVGFTDLSQADASLYTRASGTLANSGQVDTCTFTVPSAVTSGQLTVRLTATTGTLAPLLTLAGTNGQLLIQSDAAIVQYL
jgi:hypothetical protein